MFAKAIPWIRLSIGSFLFFSVTAKADWDVNMRPGVTEVSHQVYDLHMIIFWICVVIGVVVFGIMFWSIIAHRKSLGAKPATFHESTTIEIIWTAIPFAILIGMAVPATSALINIYDPSESDLDIKVTGYQWKWHYDYLEEEIGFFSNLNTSPDEIYNRAEKNDHYLLEVDEPLVVPINKKVRFLVTANDVIHSWWVPEIAVKKDAIPGFVNEAWTIIPEPGVYRGQCAELCGKDHGFMPIVVEAKTQEDYDAWLAERQAAAARERELRDKVWTLEELMERGQKVYASNCAACHNADGSGIPPAFPALKGSPVATGPIEAHLNVVLNGRPGTYMAAFGPQLSPVELAAVITYERNAWGNSKGDMIQPIDIANRQAAE
ncbi:MAG: cytochrome c oxidase subunit II [Pseudomonadales bacterium]